MLPHLSVAKRGYISEGNLAEVVPYTLYKLKTWLSVAVYFCVCMMLLPLSVSSMPCKRLCWPLQAYLFSVLLPCVHIRNNCFFCLVFNKNFNIMAVRFAHQSPTLPQKNDSREGLF